MTYLIVARLAKASQHFTDQLDELQHLKPATTRKQGMSSYCEDSWQSGQQVMGRFPGEERVPVAHLWLSFTGSEANEGFGTVVIQQHVCVA